MEFQFSISLSLFLVLCIPVLLLLKSYIFPNGSINVSLYYADNPLNKQRISLIPKIRQCYRPPVLLRHSILSTLAFGLIGRFGRRQLIPKGKRLRVPLPDGTDCTFDLYLEPVGGDPSLGNVVIVLLPGMLNSSDTDYVRAYIEYASCQGFRVACYSHHDSLPGETVSPRAPRHVSYGGTGDFTAMMDFLTEAFPSAKFIGVGLSLGANILFKYLGEEPLRQQRFLGAQSWCQGYDAGKCFQARCKFGYATGIFYRLVAAKLKYNIRKKYLEKLFGPKIEGLHSSETSPVSMVHTYARVRDRKPGLIDRTRDANGYLLEGWEEIPPFNRREFEESSSMTQLDAAFMLPLLGFKTLADMYHWSSSYSYMGQINDLPVLLVNAKTDPLVPWWIADDIMREYCLATNDKAVGVMSEYGGHLGFYQGSYFVPPRVTWLDEVSIEHAKSLVQLGTNHSLIHSE